MTIKTLREKKNLTKTELAKQTGVSRQTIYNIESGRFTPKYDLAESLSDVLGVSVAKIYKICEQQNATYKSGGNV